MTRFDAATPAERRKLFVDAIEAHRERASAFLTIEADPTATESADEVPVEDEAVGTDGSPGDDESSAAVPAPPWVQFAERTFNLDCTDEELDRLESLLDDYPEFRIDQLERPEDVQGTNVRITARADANRLAGFVDRAFQTVYEREEGYRAWVVAI